MTELAEVPGGKLLRDDREGPLVVLSPGIGDMRQASGSWHRSWRRPATGWPASTCAAAKGPELVPGIVELNPFTRTQSLKVGALFRIRRYRRGITLLLSTQMTHSLRLWTRYLNLAYPPRPPTGTVTWPRCTPS